MYGIVERRLSPIPFGIFRSVGERDANFVDSPSDLYPLQNFISHATPYYQVVWISLLGFAQSGQTYHIESLTCFVEINIK